MIRAIGAGVGRTGTRSLQKALEHLLKGKCYHMFEVGKKPDDITFWKNVAQGKKPNWSSFFSQWSAAVDWPAAAFWPEISANFPNALIILSKRDPEEWWSSASNTIFKVLRQAESSAWKEMVFEVLRSRFTVNITDKDECIAFYLDHYQSVLENVDPKRLLEWLPTDGWEPICKSLNVPIPNIEFPHLNDAKSFQKKYLVKTINLQ